MQDKSLYLTTKYIDILDANKGAVKFTSYCLSAVKFTICEEKSCCYWRLETRDVKISVFISFIA